MSVTDPIVPGRVDFAGAGAPSSPIYGDVYHSASGALAQAEAVFVAGSDLPARWQGRHRFTVLETGFGFGVNFLATWNAWRRDARRCRRLHFVSVEKHPLAVADARRVLEGEAALEPLSRRLLAAWPMPVGGVQRLHFDDASVDLTLFVGDIDSVARRIVARFDALYLDGFSPERNPAMWSVPVLKAVVRLAAPGATVATWSVASAVRDALAQAGFATEKRPGFGSKRERLVGRFAPRRAAARERIAAPPAPNATTADAAAIDPARSARAPAGGDPGAPAAEPAERRALVVGAGLAGTAVANRLARRGWEIDVVDFRPAAGAGASGNPAGVFQPLLSADDNTASRLSRACLLYALAEWRRLTERGASLPMERCGVLRIARDPAHEAKQREAIVRRRLPAELAGHVDREQASDIAGARVAAGGWWFPSSGWIRPPALCEAWIADGRGRIRLCTASRIASLSRDAAGWSARDPAGRVVTRAPVVVLACGSEVGAIAGLPRLSLRQVRGQLTLIPRGRLPALGCVVSREGYVTPAIGEAHVLGATYDFDDASAVADARGHAGNLARLGRLLCAELPPLDPTRLEGRVGFRSVARDRLPAIGGVDRPPPAGTRDSSRERGGGAGGLFAALAYASRGVVWASLCGELLASMIEGEPLPIERDVLDTIAASRLLADGTGASSVESAAFPDASEDRA